jgi:hypothetical protein
MKGKLIVRLARQSTGHHSLHLRAVVSFRSPEEAGNDHGIFRIYTAMKCVGQLIRQDPAQPRGSKAVMVIWSVIECAPTGNTLCRESTLAASNFTLAHSLTSAVLAEPFPASTYPSQRPILPVYG